MSDKVTGIPVKRKTKFVDNSQNKSGTKTDSNFVNKSQKSGQSSPDKRGNSAEMGREGNMSKSANKKQNSGVEQTTENGVQDSAGNKTEKNMSSFECSNGVASLTYSSDQNVLYYAVLSVVTVLGFATRLYKLDVPAWIW
jgi:hypothetical protein